MDPKWRCWLLEEVGELFLLRPLVALEYEGGVGRRRRRHAFFGNNAAQQKTREQDETDDVGADRYLSLLLVLDPQVTSRTDSKPRRVSQPKKIERAIVFSNY
eukprot:scaffold15108_cov180-Amphora_coffeaeformis.AAC.52